MFTGQDRADSPRANTPQAIEPQMYQPTHRRKKRDVTKFNNHLLRRHNRSKTYINDRWLGMWMNEWMDGWMEMNAMIVCGG